MACYWVGLRRGALRVWETSFLGLMLSLSLNKNKLNYDFGRETLILFETLEFGSYRKQWNADGFVEWQPTSDWQSVVWATTFYHRRFKRLTISRCGYEWRLHCVCSTVSFVIKFVYRVMWHKSYTTVAGQSCIGWGICRCFHAGGRLWVTQHLHMCSMFHVSDKNHTETATSSLHWFIKLNMWL